MAKVISLSLRDALYAELLELAELNGKNVQGVIRVAIDLFLEAYNSVEEGPEEK